MSTPTWVARAASVDTMKCLPTTGGASSLYLKPAGALDRVAATALAATADVGGAAFATSAPSAVPATTGVCPGRLLGFEHEGANPRSASAISAAPRRGLETPRANRRKAPGRVGAF